MNEAYDFLDNDLYNFNMSQFIWKHYPNVQVRYAFKNRSQHKVHNRVRFHELVAALDTVEAMTPSLHDLRKLQEMGFDKEWVAALNGLKVPEIYVEAGEKEFIIYFEGPWWRAVFLETPVLATVNELYIGQSGAWGQHTLEEKIDQLKLHPYLNFIEFGTRRRANKKWQQTVIGVMKEQRPWQLKGTSNVRCATGWEIPAVGTMAHQLFMVLAALDNHNAIDSQNAILTDWQHMFSNHPLTALTDTYGTEFFLDNLFNPSEFCRLWNVRQDSGDPLAFGEKVLKFWGHHGVDARSKVMTFSDGLDVRKMADIYGQLGTLTNVMFGWGTNLTNDVGVKPVSIVIKPEEASFDGVHWAPCCKLSDNRQKAIGNADIIQLYKNACVWNTTYSVKATY